MYVGVFKKGGLFVGEISVRPSCIVLKEGGGFECGFIVCPCQSFVGSPESSVLLLYPSRLPFFLVF